MQQQPSSQDQQRLYRDLAWLWPIISPPEDYVAESMQFVETIRRLAHRDVRTLLHLGCGGGHNDFTFKQSFQVAGVDVSEEMLAIARSLNPEAAYHRDDIRKVRLGQTFDAVVALDSMNYMLNEADLRAAFAAAYAHLEPGGVFLTCAMETRERFQQNKTVGSGYAREGVEVTFVENLYDPNHSDTTYEATFVYLIRRSGRLTIETDQHVCGLFPLETWIAQLLEAGFGVQQMEYAPSDSEPYPVLVGLKPGAT